MIFAVLRKFLRMLYAFDSSRNCVVFAYPNICKRANIKKVLTEILEKEIYRQDYEAITKQLLFENVSYEIAISGLKAVVESSLFDF